MSWLDKFRKSQPAQVAPKKPAPSTDHVKNHTLHRKNRRVFVNGEWHAVGDWLVRSRPPSEAFPKYTIWSDVQTDRYWVSNGYGWDRVA